MDKPVTDSDWTIHSLNIHGVFFHKLIASIVQDHGTVQLVSLEYPVEFPAGSSKEERSDSRLDVLARVPYHNDPSRRIDLCIECKKANPEFVDWVFFPTAPISFGKTARILSIFPASTAVGVRDAGYAIRSKLFHEIEFADDARETRGTFQNLRDGTKTKTSNAAISDAAYQVILATHAMIDYEMARFERLRLEPSFSYCVYLPIIVTTANLLLCAFEPRDTSISTGEISFDRATLRPVERLFLEYPIPPHLHIRRDDYWGSGRPQDRNKHIRRHVLVVNSKDFKSTLDWLVGIDDFLVTD